MASYGATPSEYDDRYGSPSPGVTRRNVGTSLSPYDIDPKFLPKSPEFIFPVERQMRGLGAKMFDVVGRSYLTGLSVGSMWGVMEGIRNRDGLTGRLKINNFVNGATRRGPFLGNTLGVIALMYSFFEHGLSKATELEDNTMVKISAATLTGALFKSTAGLRPIGIGATVGAGLSGLYFAGNYLFLQDRTFSFR